MPNPLTSKALGPVPGWPVCFEAPLVTEHRPGGSEKHSRTSPARRTGLVRLWTDAEFRRSWLQDGRSRGGNGYKNEGVKARVTKITRTRAGLPDDQRRFITAGKEKIKGERIPSTPPPSRLLPLLCSEHVRRQACFGVGFVDNGENTIRVRSKL